MSGWRSPSKQPSCQEQQLCCATDQTCCCHLHRKSLSDFGRAPFKRQRQPQPTPEGAHLQKLVVYCSVAACPQKAQRAQLGELAPSPRMHGEGHGRRSSNCTQRSRSLLSALHSQVEAKTYLEAQDQRTAQEVCQPSEQRRLAELLKQVNGLLELLVLSATAHVP